MEQLTQKKIDHKHVWRLYEQGISYKTTIHLYDNVKLNQNFYLGRQWEGVNAPDIEKPVVNIIRQAVDYFVSMMVSDDIGVQTILPEDTPEEVRQAIEYIVSNEIDKIMEQVHYKSKLRKSVKNCALDGDTFVYHRWSSELNKESEYVGGVDVELLDNTNVIFCNPTQMDVQKQDSIIIIKKLPVKQLRKMARENGLDESMITEDTDDYNQAEVDARAVEKYGTLLTYFWKENGDVYAIQTVKNGVIKKPLNTTLKYFPIANFSWRVRKDSYHGESPVTSVRQNQIMINKYYMMLNEFIKKLAFPKLLYDQTKIARWTNKVEAIAVNGDPNLAFVMQSPSMQLSNQVIEYINDLITKTKETLGVFDVALGNVQPDNTSAIIALQKTASQPLELQKMDFYQMIEDSIRIMLDIMSKFYGVRRIPIKVPPNEAQMILLPQGTDEITAYIDFNYADISPEKILLHIDIGASAYWSELMQVQTLDNMFRAGIIPNAKTYVEQLPDGLIKSKKDILKAIEEEEAKQMQQQMMGSMEQSQPLGQSASNLKTGDTIANKLKR